MMHLYFGRCDTSTCLLDGRVNVQLAFPINFFLLAGGLCGVVLYGDDGDVQKPAELWGRARPLPARRANLRQPLRG